jgi:hypothetical protein
VIGKGTAAACLSSGPTGVNDLDQRGLPRHTVQRGGHCDPGAWDSGAAIAASGTVLGTVLFPALHGRVGFIGSNLPGRSIQYISAQIGGISFLARAPLTLDCPDQCAGTPTVFVPGTVTLRLSGPISMARGGGGIVAGATAVVLVTIFTTDNPNTRTITEVEAQVLPPGGGAPILDTGPVAPTTFPDQVLLLPV